MFFFFTLHIFRLILPDIHINLVKKPEYCILPKYCKVPEYCRKIFKSIYCPGYFFTDVQFLVTYPTLVYVPFVFMFE